MPCPAYRGTCLRRGCLGGRHDSPARSGPSATQVATRTATRTGKEADEHESFDNDKGESDPVIGDADQNAAFDPWAQAVADVRMRRMLDRKVIHMNMVSARNPSIAERP